MRLAPVLLLAACSSPAPTPMSTHPGDDVVVTFDAAPVVGVIEPAPPDADLGPCLPADSHLWMLRGDALQLCGGAEEDDVLDSGACFEVTPAGTITVIDTVQLDFGDGRLDPRIKPKRDKGQVVVAARLDDAKATWAVVMQREPLGAPRVELWDAATRKRLASVTLPAPAGVASYRTAFLGDAVFVMELTSGGDGTVHGLLLLRAGTKLRTVTTLTSVDAWMTLDAGHAVVATSEGAWVIDVTTGEPTAELDWPAISPGAADVPRLAFGRSPDGRFGVAATAGEDPRLLGLGTFTADGKVASYPARICAAD